EAAEKSNAQPGTNEQKIGDFYASCMDTAAIEAAGTKPLDPDLARIALIKNQADLQTEVARLQRIGTGVLFRFGSSQDAKDSTQVIAVASQGGLGLPDRDYYVRDDEKSKLVREAYLKHLARMFALLGDPADKSAAEASTVMTIETALANASLTNVDLRDPNKTYHPTSLAGLKTLAPNFSWEHYFDLQGRPDLKSINV